MTAIPHASSTQGAQAPNRVALASVYLTVFIDLLGFGIILPLLPYFAERHGASGLSLGAITTAYSAAQFIGAPILGRLSDRVGRRPVLIFSLVGASISLALTGLADSLVMLVATRALAGLFGGSISTAQAYVADVTSPNERARYMGFLGASIGAGFVFGPALGSLMAPLGFSAATWVASGLALFNAVLTYRRVPESAPAAARRPSGRSALPLARLRGVGLRSVSAQVAISMFFSTWAFVAMETTFPLLGERRFGLTERSLGWVLTYVGVVVVVVQGKLLYAVVRRRGEVATALLGGALMAGSLLGLSFAHTLSTSLLALGGLSAGQGLLSPSLTALLSKVAGAEDRGGVLGMGQGLAALARAVGPVVSGWLFDLNPASPYWLAAAFVLIALANLARLPIPQPHVETEFVAAPET